MYFVKYEFHIIFREAQINQTTKTFDKSVTPK